MNVCVRVCVRDRLWRLVNSVEGKPECIHMQEFLCVRVCVSEIAFKCVSLNGVSACVCVCDCVCVWSLSGVCGCMCKKR